MWPEMESVSSQLPPPRSISSARRLAMRALSQHAQVDEAAFFQSGDDFHFPAGRGAYPVEKRAAVARVAQGAGGDHAYPIGAVSLRSAVEAAQHAQRERHRLRIQRSVGENAFAQASHFAIFVQSFQPAAYDLGYLQPDRVRTDVNRGECWHARVNVKSKKYQLLNHHLQEN